MTNEEILNEIEIKFLLEILNDRANKIKDSTKELLDSLSSDESLRNSGLSPDKTAMIRAMKLVSPVAFDNAVKEFAEMSSVNDTRDLLKLSNIITKLSLQKSLL